MEILVVNEEGLDIVSGMIDGDLTKQIAADYFAEVSKIAQAHDIKRVLTDVRRAKLLAGDEEMKSLSLELPGIGIDQSCRRAILISNDIEGYKTWENYCFKHGFHKVKIFLDQEVAIDWLSQN